MWLNRFRRKIKTDIPQEAELRCWAQSAWVEYQAWLFHHSFITLQDWQQQRHAIHHWDYRPLISIVTPVFNTPPHYLTACIRSVQTQTYPYWEHCLVDDGSDNPSTIECLKTGEHTDRRLRLYHLPHNQGICTATNRALAMARGEYIAFLDHDDRLAPDALYHIVSRLNQRRAIDFIYTDRDLISPQGYRYMHMLKPGWSPESLLATNYTCHLTVYRRTMIEEMGEVDKQFEGSQDHDLVLRVAETNPIVAHIPKILYHWRQHQQSVAYHHEAKTYAYQAAQQAIAVALKRRGLRGTVSEIPTLWRGNYRVQLTPMPPAYYQVLQMTTLTHYAEQINQAFTAEVQALVILGPGVQPIDPEAIDELVAWLQITEVSMVTGKILDRQRKLYHAGLVQRENGIPLAVYAGHPENTPGYMAVTAVVRNVSTPHPACCVIKRTVWQDLGGLDTTYAGPHALLDFALRALHNQMRIVYTPFARFKAEQWLPPAQWPDYQRYATQWQEWLTQGDPYYHPALTLTLTDMGLDMNWTECDHES